MAQHRIPMTLSLPSEIARQFGKLAKEEAKNKSELFRDMFRAFQQQRSEREFLDLQRYGAAQAVAKGVLTEDDVDRIVKEGR